MIASFRAWAGNLIARHWIDLAIAFAIFTVAVAVYTRHSAGVLAGALLSDNNLVFDFDPANYTAMWCETPFPKDLAQPGFLARHPLVLAVRPLCQALMGLGAAPKFAALILASSFTALSAALVYVCGRALGVNRVFSVLVSAIFACSSVSMFLAVIPEAYGIAETGLILQFLVAILWCKSRPPHFLVRVAVGLVNFGVTITNVLLSGLCEIAFQIQRQPWHAAARRVAIFTLVIALAGITAGMLLMRLYVGENPTETEAAKNLWWAANMPAQYRQPPHSVLGNFALSSVVSPRFSNVRIGFSAEGAAQSNMLDIREFDFEPVGLAGVVSWTLLIGLSVYAAARDRSFRVFWLLVAAWFAFNVVLHSAWHYRGSVFLYASHAHAALILLPFAFARWAQVAPIRQAGAAALLLAVIIPTCLNNSQKLVEMLSLLK